MAESKNDPKPDGKTPPAAAGAKGAAPEAAGADALRDHLSTIALVVVVVVAVTLVIVFQVRKDRDRNEEAWSRLASLRQKAPTGTDGFAELAAKYRGTEADPFIRLTWAARLYEAGAREQVEEAKTLLEQVLREHGKNPFLRERIAGQLERVKAELADPRAQLVAAAVEAPPPPITIDGLEEDGHDGHDHGPGDGHDHDGHDHDDHDGHGH
ncbi:MAG: hypothetical protein M9894_11940 [Planctomycetes bacterium]|nr:hypothetical protein [Planctomycetota bacterium]